MLKVDGDKVYIEYCHNCGQHQWCTMHVEEKYASYFNACRREILDLSPEVSVRDNEVPPTLRHKFVEEGTGMLPSLGKVSFPRMGAFEVYLRGKTVFSKLESGHWPHPGLVAAKIKEALDQLRLPPTIHETRRPTKKKKLKHKKKSRKNRSDHSAPPLSEVRGGARSEITPEKATSRTNRSLHEAGERGKSEIRTPDRAMVKRAEEVEERKNRSRASNDTPDLPKPEIKPPSAKPPPALDPSDPSDDEYSNKPSQREPASHQLDYEDYEDKFEGNSSDEREEEDLPKEVKRAEETEEKPQERPKAAGKSRDEARKARETPPPEPVEKQEHQEEEENRENEDVYEDDEYQEDNEYQDDEEENKEETPYKEAEKPEEQSADQEDPYQDDYDQDEREEAGSQGAEQYEEPIKREVTKSFELPLKVNVDCSKKITYENKQDRAAVYTLTSSNPEVMEIKEPEVAIAAHSKGKFQLRFFAVDRPQVATIYLLVDENDTQVECIEITAKFEDN
jgi:selT/selW/selH-like putative selenoprotein